MRPFRFFVFASASLVIASALAAENVPVFETNCVACHGADGSARTPQGRKVKARDLRVSKLTDAEIERQIREGSKNKTGTVVMPAFGRDLTDTQIQEAIRAVKSFRPPETK